MEEEIKKTLEIAKDQKNLLIKELENKEIDINKKTQIILDIDKLDGIINKNIKLIENNTIDTK